MNISKNIHNKGILIGVDEKLEWLLPWWWSRYSAQNNFPVAFVDFGLSHYGKSYCKNKGEVLDCNPRIPIWASSHEQGEILFGNRFQISRKSWYKKPFALLATPFEKTLWLDIDCEVLQPLDLLFQKEGEVYLAKETKSAMDRDQNLESGEILYNSGVIFYRKNAELIQKWTNAVQREKEQFWSDQHTLSRVIYREKLFVHQLEEEYNWRITQGININAIIVHWVGSWGKEYIRRFGGIADELAEMGVK